MGLKDFFIRKRTPEEDQAVKEQQERRRREAAEEQEARRQGRLAELKMGRQLPKAGPTRQSSGGFRGFLANANKNVMAGSSGGLGFTPRDAFAGFKDPFSQRNQPFSSQPARRRKAVKKRSGVIIVDGKRYIPMRRK